MEFNVYEFLLVTLVTSIDFTTGATQQNETTTTNSSILLSGTDLWCYECSEQYDSTFDPSQSPCLTNLSQITIRQCSPGDTYCQVSRETYDRLGFTLSIQRGCVGTCNYGCYGHNYGSSTLVCTSCCASSPGCNSGNGAKRTLSEVHELIYSTVVAVITIRSVVSLP